MKQFANMIEFNNWYNSYVKLKDAMQVTVYQDGEPMYTINKVINI